jgi:hypothetical protein
MIGLAGHACLEPGEKSRWLSINHGVLTKPTVNHLLNDADVRVLGALIEKAVTTPDYYPLTLNALTSACNQTTNRTPVVHFDEATVAAALEHLRTGNLVHQIKRSDSRVTKYRHVMAEALNLEARELAVMCVLMLRGPQTAGEIRTRGSRLFDFASVEEVEQSLTGLMARTASPLVVRLPRRPGQKETRYAHLLSGEVSVDAPEATVVRERTDAERLDTLEEALRALRAEVDDLRAQLDQLRT